MNALVQALLALQDADDGNHFWGPHCCDDDTLLIPSTNLELAKRLYEENDLDILTVQQEGNQFYGIYTQRGIEISCSREAHRLNGDVAFYDFDPNLFLMRADKVKLFPWDDCLKTREHFA